MQSRVPEKTLQIVARWGIDGFFIDVKEDIIMAVVQQREQDSQLLPVAVCHDKKCMSHAFTVPFIWFLSRKSSRRRSLLCFVKLKWSV